MTSLHAFLLGLLQGVAEFLPISSSGHLEIARTLFGLEDVPQLFDIALHVATLIVVAGVFRKRILAILAAVWNFLFGRKHVPHKALTKTQLKKDEIRKNNLAYVVPLLIATAITGVIGFAIEKFLPSGGVKAVSARMLVTALILGGTFFLKPGTRQPGALGTGRSALLGLAQGIGVFSGISRSGITISAGLLAGMDRSAAGEFSFLLSIPAILGALLLKLGDLAAMSSVVSFGNLALAFVTAMVSGYAALKVLMRLVKGGKLFWFAPYLVVVGIIGLVAG